MWAKNNPGIDDEAREIAQQNSEWSNTKNRLKLINAARKTLFSELPEDEQEEWEEKSKDAKTPDISQLVLRGLQRNILLIYISGMT